VSIGVTVRYRSEAHASTGHLGTKTCKSSAWQCPLGEIRASPWNHSASRPAFRAAPNARVTPGIVIQASLYLSLRRHFAPRVHDVLAIECLQVPHVAHLQWTITQPTRRSHRQLRCCGTAAAKLDSNTGAAAPLSPAARGPNLKDAVGDPSCNLRHH